MRARLLGARTRGSSSERFKTGVTGARSEITRADGGAAAVMGSHPTSTQQSAVCAQSDFAAQAGSRDAIAESRPLGARVPIPSFMRLRCNIYGFLTRALKIAGKSTDSCL